MSYPRTCRNGHEVAGPQDEHSNGRTGRRKCRRCADGPRHRLSRDKYEWSTKGMAARCRERLNKAHRALETHEAQD